MQKTLSPFLRHATLADADTLNSLINRAFEVERFFLAEDRIDPEQIRLSMRSGTFLVLEHEGSVRATVYCQIKENVGLIGMLSVDPAFQGQGMGRRMIEEAEAFFRQRGCQRAELRVVNLRRELPPFYRKMGFTDMEIEPFPDTVPVLQSCHLTRMGKNLTPLP